jgi:hypothetical protein
MIFSFSLSCCLELFYGFERELGLLLLLSLKATLKILDLLPNRYLFMEQSHHHLRDNFIVEFENFERRVRNTNGGRYEVFSLSSLSCLEPWS